MTPYYRSPDGAILVYCARWEDVLAAGLIPVRDVALVHADPPYGVRMQADRSKTRGGIDHPRRAFAPVVGDDAPVDPDGLLALGRPTVMWGANNFAARLPPSAAWLVWDKRVDMPADDGSDCEMAWSNIGASARMFRHVWKGLCRDSERFDSHLHPTQKPIALCSWVFRERAKLRPGALVLVPYMGSGPELAACVAMGLRCIACEVSEDYCRAAVGARLHASPTSPLDALPLFAPRPTP